MSCMHLVCGVYKFNVRLCYTNLCVSVMRGYAVPVSNTVLEHRLSIMDPLFLSFDMPKE